jgi:NAD-dependent dihydropyrimidine dehydrogenase PreA subunit
LCVAACPNGVLRPSTKLSTFMQPEMGFEHGYCRPECTKCGEVCPAGAINPSHASRKPQSAPDTQFGLKTTASHKKTAWRVATVQNTVLQAQSQWCRFPTIQS